MTDKLNNFVNNLKQVDLLQIDWRQLLDWEYLTDINPTKHFIYEQWIYVIVLVNLFFALVSFRLVAVKLYDHKPKYRLFRRGAFLWFSNTILLLLYNLIRSEGVRFLSMRLFLVLIILFYVSIVLYLLIYWIFILPKRSEKFKEARLRDKYVRDRKKKKR